MASTEFRVGNEPADRQGVPEHAQITNLSATKIAAPTRVHPQWRANMA